jgi:hypothetical protein
MSLALFSSEMRVYERTLQSQTPMRGGVDIWKVVEDLGWLWLVYEYLAGFRYAG